MIGIYKITSPTNKVYIGQSTNIGKRFLQYKNYACKNQTKLYHSFKKYGIDKHKFEIVEECLKSELNEKEIYYIELFQCFNSKYGLNLKTGGNGGGMCSEETKAKMSLNRTGLTVGEKNGMFGKTHTTEVRDHLRKINKGLHSRSKHILARKVINTVTNEIFGCAKDAYESMNGEKFGVYGGGSYSHFIACLSGIWKNKTSFKYCDK